MPRHRQSLRLPENWGPAGVRVAALLTLVLGVTGGLHIADTRAEQDIPSSMETAAADRAEQAALIADKIAWSKAKVAADAAERARLAAEIAAEKAAAAAEAARKKAAEEASRARTTPVFGPIPASCNVYSGNRAIGCALMLEAGYGLDQMACLEPLWTKESGWNHLSSNNSSGAYGIPQALPGNKMASYGDDWRTNPATQIRWGLSYIKGRYSTPCGAWQFFQRNNWY